MLAKPADGCKVIGWKGLPEVGAEVLEVDSEKRAKEVVQWRLKQEEERKKTEDAKTISKQRDNHNKQYTEYRRAKLEAGIHKAKYGWFDFHTREKENIEDDDERPRVKIMIKCDVDGSKDAILSCIDTYDDSTVRLDVVVADVGEITQEDVELASGFEV